MERNLRLSLARVRDGLTTSIIGRTLLAFRELPSTNQMAKELARTGVREGTVIIAETQTHGRGRLDREWFSPAGGLWFSIILKPKVSPREAPKLSLIGSLAVAKTLRRLYGLRIEIKWPNDVLISGKKVCGVLSEMNVNGDSPHFVVLGIGINANFEPKDFPADLQSSSTTLKEELRTRIDREALIRELLKEIERCYLLFSHGRFSALMAEWKGFFSFWGKYVEVINVEGKIEGWIEDVDKDGSLVVKLENGDHRKVISGDLFIRTRLNESPNED